MFFKICFLLYLFQIVESVSPFSKFTITYAVVSFPKNLSKNDTLEAFRYAFNQWSNIIPHKFEDITNTNESYKYQIGIYFPNLASEVLSETDIDGIFFNHYANWKKYNEGERIIIEENVKYDITTAAMKEIRNLLIANNVNDKNSIKISSYYIPISYKNEGRYRFPKILRR